jgi:hypothetical protein
MIIISLIGEQPIPNLLPIRYQPPNVAVLVHTGRTQAAAERLTRLLPDGCEPVPCLVSAYDIQEIVHALQALIEKRGWLRADILVNLTGGTKAMALAAHSIAASYGAPFLYLQSEGKQTRLYRYEFDSDGNPCVAASQLLPALITINDYLRAYVDDYRLLGFAKDDSGGLFERAVYEALEPVVDEIVAGARLLQALEIDLIVRCLNQVGIIEAKTGPGVKKGIDQLNTAGGQRYLGTYTRKMLVSDQCWDESRSNLRKLAEARRVKIIELPSFCASQQLSSGDVEQLRCQVCEQLGREIGA